LKFESATIITSSKILESDQGEGRLNDLNEMKSSCSYLEIWDKETREKKTMWMILNMEEREQYWV